MLEQIEINKQLWKICNNFKNKTEIKKNYIVYISVLLFIKYCNCAGNNNFDMIYNTRNKYYIGADIDKVIRKVAIEQNDNNLFSNVRFKDITVYRDTGEENIIEKTIEEIHDLLCQVKDRRSVAEAYDFILEQSIYRDDIIKETGEFHTPAEIARVMANITISNDNINVYDPICNSGNILKSAVETYKVRIFGRENNLDYYNILKTRLLLYEINSDNIMYGNDNKDINIRADAILFNPPFADKSWKENDFLKDIGYKYGILVGDYVYILNMLEKLNSFGKMAVILPHGALFRENEKRIRKNLIEDNLIEAIIGLPENLFYGTRIPVIIMVISKNRKEDGVLFIDASQDYDNDRKNNILSKEYQDKIIDTYKEKKEIEKYSHLVAKEEIINNDFDLTIKKYIYKKKKRELVNKEELTQNVKKLKLEQEKLEENIKDVLEVLGYRDIGEVQTIEKENEDKTIKSYGDIDYFLIGKRIYCARRQKNMTQEELAEKMDVSSSYMSRIERGGSQITLNFLVKLCDILGISVEEILRGNKSI